MATNENGIVGIGEVIAKCWPLRWEKELLPQVSEAYFYKAVTLAVTEKIDDGWSAVNDFLVKLTDLGTYR